jgi:Xaa-Pro aminopeptidase
MTDIKNRITHLRAAMKAAQIDAYIIPSSDPHQGEYVAEHWQSRAWISGFSGSAGTVVVTEKHLGLWTDSRYYLQAPEELKAADGHLHKMDGSRESWFINWLIDQLPNGATLGCDGRLFTEANIRKIERRLDGNDLTLKSNVDLISEVWSDRPELSLTAIEDFPVKYAGESREQKLMRIQQKLREENVDGLWMSGLDDIAWTLNLRGQDVPLNPLFYSYLLITADRHYLFIDEEKVSPEIAEDIAAANVELRPYADAFSELKAHSARLRLWVDPNTASRAIFEALSDNDHLEKAGPVRGMKAIKNETEITNIRHAMVKDGVALVRAFRWLEEQLRQRPVKETEVAEKLAHFRSQQALYRGESFDAIVGYRGNGAIVHYHATAEKQSLIRNEGVLLVDSGGQYLDGTTDITRTFALGEVSEEVKENYTRVLKGHIARAQAVFPEGTRGVQLDVLARQYLWQEGLNYGHGTGHGVGFFLNVHEPPQGFVPNLSERGTTPLREGMFSSNEPGYYKAHEYGIRIENLILAVQKGSDHESEDFLCFEDLTLYPISKELIDIHMLNDSEKKWLNTYHERVFQALSPQLTEAERDWLNPQCAPIL